MDKMTSTERAGFGARLIGRTGQVGRRDVNVATRRRPIWAGPKPRPQAEIGGKLSQAVAGSEGRRFCPVGGSYFIEDVADVGGDSPDPDYQFFRYLAVGLAGGD